MGAIAKAGPESEKRDAMEELVMGGVCCCCCEDMEEREEVNLSDGPWGGAGGAVGWDMPEEVLP